ncbi:MAG: alkylhydroperoxidase [Alphaproteobacteria bacterium TMED199]|nr:MAG: alkylhydroperoxidase [Alphaproteobacteria bacterium TMED199]
MATIIKQGQKSNLTKLDLDYEGTKDGEDQVKNYLEIVQEKLGFIPNVLAAFAKFPKQFEGFTKLYNALMLGESGLTKLEREMIAVTVSSENHCFYCLVAHGSAVRELSNDPQLGERIAANFKSAELPKKQEELLNFTKKLTKDPSEIIENDRKKLRDVGYTDRDIWDISAIVGLFNMTNRLASATDMEPNNNYHNLAR